MTEEGSSANWYGGRLSGYTPAQPDTRRFSSGAVIPGVGYSEPASLVTKNRIRMEHAPAIPVPALAPERSSLCR